MYIKTSQLTILFCSQILIINQSNTRVQTNNLFLRKKTKTVQLSTSLMKDWWTSIISLLVLSQREESEVLSEYLFLLKYMYNKIQICKMFIITTIVLPHLWMQMRAVTENPHKISLNKNKLVKKSFEWTYKA